MSRLMVVESPAKARTLQKYLGSSSTVVASYGHVRDLPPRDGSVKPDDQFAMDWQVKKEAGKNLQILQKAVQSSDHILLATDPDREGEAISWHIYQWLAQKKLLEGKQVERVVFHEITRTALDQALADPRPINDDLVNAYLARRALDYLVGFNLSPLLWRKLPGSRSAGRVQSVALRLICERDREIDLFRPQDYWTIEGIFSYQGATFAAKLKRLRGQELDTLSLCSQDKADEACTYLSGQDFVSTGVQTKDMRRRPLPPFTTSTLQQASFLRLSMSGARTMRAAQKLYEGIDLGQGREGLITYMRTDSTTLSTQALSDIRSYLGATWGKDYVPAQAVIHKTKTRNAQEAHEAIRPTDIRHHPDDIAARLDTDERRVYDLIWRRACASQMPPAHYHNIRLDIDDGSADSSVFRSTGSRLIFDGFQKVWPTSSKDEEKAIIPAVPSDASLTCKQVDSNQHTTKPPSRYSEASLVKTLEELGIGRPSTYVSIIGVLKDRDYVRVEKRHFISAERGRVVTSFLTKFFARYVEYQFTANMEKCLDEIAQGRLSRVAMLQDFWQPFSLAVEATKSLSIRDVIDHLDADLDAYLFPKKDDQSDPRLCPTCSQGRVSLRLGKFGPFLGCERYPDCRYTRPLLTSGNDDNPANTPNVIALGDHPDGGAVEVRLGPYGAYVQWAKEGEEKAKRVTLPKGQDITKLSLAEALALLSLPRDIVKDPETGIIIQAGIGRYGPYVSCQRLYASLAKGDDVLTVGGNRAIALIAQARQKRAAKPAAVKKKAAKPAAVKKKATKPAAVKKRAAKPAAVKKRASKPAAVKKKASKPAAVKKKASSSSS